jgi:hypothetical protein
MSHENRLDRHFEYVGYPEGERKRGIVLAGFDRVDRLSADLEPLGQIGLAPAAFSAQHAQPVVHAQRPLPSVSRL